MVELLQANWIFLIIALVIGIFVAWWIFVANRKTKVTLEDKGDDDALAKRNQSLIDSAPAAATAPPVQTLADVTSGDDLTQIKGLGPKLAVLLGELDVSSFTQIAAWDNAEIARIDAQLGRFEGRITRDNWVAQAKLLSAGDMAAYESKFGAS